VAPFTVAVRVAVRVAACVAVRVAVRVAVYVPMHFERLCSFSQNAKRTKRVANSCSKLVAPFTVTPLTV